MIDDLLGGELSVDELRARLHARLDVPTLEFPDGWTMSTPWRRAQEARAVVGPIDAARYRVMLSRPDAAPDLGAFTDAQRDVWRRCERYGAAPCEVARETDRAPSTVRTHLQRARETLADQEPEMGDPHRVLFAILDGDLAAECDCEAWQYRDWCSHVARLWYDWSRQRIAVTDLETGERLRDPSPSLTVTDHSLDDAGADADQRARADGGEPR